MWNCIIYLKNIVIGPWVLAGDFNCVLLFEDRINGARCSYYRGSYRDFNHSFDTIALFPVSSSGNIFSRQKGIGEGKTSTRINWCLVNVEWMHDFADVVPEYLSNSISDHTPLLINCSPVASGEGRPFRFFNYLATRCKFLKTVEYVWQAHVTRSDHMYNLRIKLKKVKVHLKA